MELMCTGGSKSAMSHGFNAVDWESSSRIIMWPTWNGGRFVLYSLCVGVSCDVTGEVGFEDDC